MKKLKKLMIFTALLVGALCPKIRAMEIKFPADIVKTAAFVFASAYGFNNASIFFHELGHWLAARACGLEAKIHVGKNSWELDKNRDNYVFDSSFIKVHNYFPMSGCCARGPSGNFVQRAIISLSGPLLQSLSAVTMLRSISGKYAFDISLGGDFYEFFTLSCMAAICSVELAASVSNLIPREATTDGASALEALGLDKTPTKKVLGTMGMVGSNLAVSAFAGYMLGFKFKR